MRGSVLSTLALCAVAGDRLVAAEPMLSTGDLPGSLKEPAPLVSGSIGGMLSPFADSFANSRKLMQPAGGGGPDDAGGDTGGDAAGGDPAAGGGDPAAGGDDAAAGGGGPGDDTAAGGGDAGDVGGGGPVGAPAEFPALTPAASPVDDPAAATSPASSPTSTETTGPTCTIAQSEYCESYVVEDEEFGTMVEVVVNSTYRVITSNGIPPWDTTEFFPNPDNNFTVEEQMIEFEMPLAPIFRGTASTVREVGISVFGVMYEPGNAQRAQCDDGTELIVEAYENPFVGFGIDPNGAHIRDTTGLYHYHGPSTMEIAMSDDSQDIVHVGFMFDSHMLYYSKSGAYASSYVLSTEERTATCTYSEPDIPEFEIDSIPDGTMLEDWVFTDGAGDLDECNGLTLDGEYAYFITDTFPYVPRCHMHVTQAGEGSIENDDDDGPGGGGAGGPGAAEGPEADMLPAAAGGPEADTGAIDTTAGAGEAAAPGEAGDVTETDSGSFLGVSAVSVVAAAVTLLAL